MPNMNLLSHSKTKNGSSGGSHSSLSEPYAPTNGVPDPKSTIWQEINNRPANMTGSGKILNNVAGAVIGAADMASSSDGMIGVVKGEWGVAKTILTSVPDIIAALEPLSKIHPFVQVAYFPFKLFCEKEILRRDNDKERNELFDKIKNAMLVLLELKDIGTNDTRLTPDNKPILGRLAHICGEMNTDIDECSKALNAHDERSYFTHLRKASSWNKQLSGYANRFTKRREDLLFALNLQTATAVAKIETNVTEMVGKFSMFDRMMEKFSSFDDLAKMVKKCFEGPHSRVKEKMVASVWKRQGWANTATTSKLVSGISRYFVDQSTYSLPTNPNEDDGSDNDSETDISVPLYFDSDGWVINYVRGERLRYVEQAIDPDCSGSISIEEINSFTKVKPKEWSFPRWVAYWAIGWQIFATKCCVEIDGLFAQLKAQIVIPGNKRSVTDYIERTEQHVTALTSAIERYDSAPSWLEEQFADYIKVQEASLKKRLEKIHYDIDAPEKVSSVLGAARIEEGIFALLVLLIRQHVTKLSVGLSQELSGKELTAYVTTIEWVVKAVEHQYGEIKRNQHRPDVFEWLSCGLFKNFVHGGASARRSHSTNSDIVFPGPLGHGGSDTSTPEGGHGGAPQSAACNDGHGAGGFVKPTLSWRAPAGADPQLCRCFSRIDTDGSGEITADELQSALINGDMTRFDIRTVRTLMTLFDTDDSGTIDFNEFAGLWMFIQNWKKAFDLFDRDRSGMIEKEELRKVLLAQFRRDFSPNLLDQLLYKYAFNTAESDAPAGFSLDSFLRAVVFVKQLGEEFQQVGPDGNGLIRIKCDKFMEMALHLL